MLLSVSFKWYNDTDSFLFTESAMYNIYTNNMDRFHNDITRTQDGRC